MQSNSSAPPLSPPSNLRSISSGASVLQDTRPALPRSLKDRQVEIVEKLSFDTEEARAARAQATALAARRNAATTSEEEYQRYLLERKQLLQKKLVGELTTRENTRLEFVRWSLDRIEDARHGAALDGLEAAVELYERFSDDVRSLSESLREKSRPGQNSSRRQA